MRTWNVTASHGQLLSPGSQEIISGPGKVVISKNAYLAEFK